MRGDRRYSDALQSEEVKRVCLPQRSSSACYAPSVSVRRVASLTVLGGLGLLFGCSYDWNVAANPVDGGVTPLPSTSASSSSSSTSSASSASSSGTTTPVDAGGNVNGSTPNGPCGANCTCKDGATCELTCGTNQTCKLTCLDRSNCKLTCAVGAVCNIECRGGAQCDFTCAGGSRCTTDNCSRDTKCKGKCELGADCTNKCEDDCDVSCANIFGDTACKER